MKEDCQFINFVMMATVRSPNMGLVVLTIAYPRVADYGNLQFISENLIKDSPIVGMLHVKMNLDSLER